MNNMTEDKSKRAVVKHGGNELVPVTPADVEAKMITLRNQPVLIDTDVAALYGVETKAVNQAVLIHRSSLMDIYLSLTNSRKMRW